MSPEQKVKHDHTYCCKSTSTIDEGVHSTTERPDLQKRLKRKIKSLQQQLRRVKAKQETMSDIINELEKNVMMSHEVAEIMHS